MPTANRKRNGKAETGSGRDQKRTTHGRHEYRCTICPHAQRDEIEQAFVTWVSPDRIGKCYGVSRDAVYPHAHALGLMEKRRRNLRSALERIIEKAGEVEVSASACPLHGERFSAPHFHVYVSAWLREKQPLILLRKSTQYQKAWVAGFPAHLWPAELVTVGGKDMLRLKDGTILEAE